MLKDKKKMYILLSKITNLAGELVIILPRLDKLCQPHKIYFLISIYDNIMYVFSIYNSQSVHTAI